MNWAKHDAMVDESIAGRHIAKKSRRRWSGGRIYLLGSGWGVLCNGHGLLHNVCWPLLQISSGTTTLTPPPGENLQIYYQKILLIKCRNNKFLAKIFNLCNMPKNESRQIRWILKFFGRIGGWRGVAFVIFFLQKYFFYKETKTLFFFS